MLRHYFQLRPVATLGLVCLSLAAEAWAIDAVDVAAAQIGKPYRLAAMGPDAFDCSGLTQYAYAQVGVVFASRKLKAAEQATLGTPVCTGAACNSSALQRGDLIFFNTEGAPGTITHVGIYEGNNTMINAKWYACRDDPTPRDPPCLPDPGGARESEPLPCLRE